MDSRENLIPFVSLAPQQQQPQQSQPPQTLHQQQPQQQQMDQRTLGFGNGSHSSLPMQPEIDQNQSQNLQQRKRGRPRKYPLRDNSADPTAKRKRGRPPGSSKKQLEGATTGFGFTTHIIEVNTGEDILSKVMALTEGPRTVCVLSATGSVSRATFIRDAHNSTVTHEGVFEIITLSGSFSNYEATNRSGSLSVALARTDGRIFGGGVAGSLIAATQVQITVGSFVAEANTRNQSSGNNAGGQNPEPAPAPANMLIYGSVSQGSSSESPVDEFE